MFGSRTEVLVHRPVRIQPAQVITSRPGQRAELAPRQDLAIALDRQAKHGVISSRVEACVRRAIAVQPANVLARLPAQAQ